MGRLRMKTTKCKYKKNDRRLKEKNFNVINEDMTSEIFKELTSIKNSSEVFSEQLLI